MRFIDHARHGFTLKVDIYFKIIYCNLQVVSQTSIRVVIFFSALQLLEIIFKQFINLS